jgi:hypothetical protein
MAKSLLAGKLNKDKVQTQALTPEQIEAMHKAMTTTPTPTAAIAVVESKVEPIIAPIVVEEKPVQKVIVTKNTKEISKEIIIEEPVNEPITRLSIDVTKEMHKAMKMKVIETEQSIRDYVVSLVKKDLGLK